MIYQILLSGIVLGSIYSLFAVGMVILYRATTILNFSQGELYMLGPFLAFTLVNSLHVNYFLSIVAAILAISLLGILVFKGAFQRLMEAPHLNQVLVTVALVYVSAANDPSLPPAMSSAVPSPGHQPTSPCGGGTHSCAPAGRGRTAARISTKAKISRRAGERDLRRAQATASPPPESTRQPLARWPRFRATVDPCQPRGNETGSV